MTWNPIWPPPQMAKIKNKRNVGIIKPKKVILVCNSMFLCMTYSLVHVKMHSGVTWSKIQYGRQIAKMKSKHNFGIIEPMKGILVSNCMSLNMIYSLVHFKCTQMSHNLKSNMAAIESPKMPSLIKLCCLGWYLTFLSLISRHNNTLNTFVNHCTQMAIWMPILGNV